MYNLLVRLSEGSETARGPRNEVEDITMKYNKSEIMKMAWNLYRTTMKTNRFGTCLREAWVVAKAAANKEQFTGKKAVELDGYSFRFWQGGANRRIYINGRRADGSYVDLNTGKRVISRRAWNDIGPAIEKFFAHYEIAC